MSDARVTNDAEAGAPSQRTRVGVHDADLPSAHLEGAAGLEEVSGPTSLWQDGWNDLKGSWQFWVSLTIIILIVLMAVFPEAYLFFYDGDPNPRPDACLGANSINSSTAPNMGRPTATNWFGFDIRGCDVYTHTILGARISIFVGLTVTIGAVLIAVVFGTLAGFYGKALDAIIARITDIWFAVPTVLAALVILTVLDDKNMYTLSFVLIVFGWPSMLRLMRSQALAVKEQDFVMASRSLGASNMRLMTRHVLPNGITPVIVYAAIFLGIIIQAEAALTFLGVGIQAPAISWGLMISSAQSRVLQAPHLLFFPGMALAITVFGFMMMGDVLQSAFDPKGR